MDVPLSRPPVRANAQEEWHGTIGGYNNHRCSCEWCREAWTEYNLNRRRERRDLLELGVITAPHGTVNGYCNYGCRDDCPGDPVTGITCREASNAQRRKNYRNRAQRLEDVSHWSTVTPAKAVDQPQSVITCDLGFTHIVGA